RWRAASARGRTGSGRVGGGGLRLDGGAVTEGLQGRHGDAVPGFEPVFDDVRVRTEGAERDRAALDDRAPGLVLFDAVDEGLAALSEHREGGHLEGRALVVDDARADELARAQPYGVVESREEFDQLRTRIGMGRDEIDGRGDEDRAVRREDLDVGLGPQRAGAFGRRSEEHTSELQSRE